MEVVFISLTEVKVPPQKILQVKVLHSNPYFSTGAEVLYYMIRLLIQQPFLAAAARGEASLNCFTYSLVV